MLALALLTSLAQAQDPEDRWITIKTDHFRLMAPEAAREWSEHAAERLESMRSRVVEEVGYDPPGRIDILVRDPYSDANGSAYPLLFAPRIELWTTPPEPGSGIADYRSWDELLIEHETAHIVHMIRPSRNPLIGLLDGAFVGIGPITRKTPRWVIEGYATVVEGRLTGSGRPNSPTRAAYLRGLAAEGRLPTYWQLDGNGRWRGYSDAYMVGSAFLEWLDDNRGDGSLRSLWGGLTARQNRDFSTVFEEVYGKPPNVLYGEFTAELTHDAVQIEEERGPVSGTLFLDTDGWTGDPAVSPDGTRLAIGIARTGKTPQLRVYDTMPDAKAEAAYWDGIDERLLKDPEDVRPIVDSAFVHRDAARVRFVRPASAPRWLSDNQRILLTTWDADPDGRFRTDLWIWDSETGQERRVTRHGDVKQGDPAPDGTWAVAVSARWGITDLVRVDLATGELTPIVEGSPSRVLSHPRISPDGLRLVFCEQTDGNWHLVVRELASGAESRVPTPEGSVTTDPAWTKDGRIVASVGFGEAIEIWRIEPVSGAATILTRSHAGAYGPEPFGERLFWLSETADGLDLRTGPIAEVDSPIAGAVGSSVVPPVDPPSTSLPPPAPVEVRRYGAGPFQARLLASAQASPGGAEEALILRLGDPVGRWESLVMGVSGTYIGAGAQVRASVLPIDVIGGTWVTVGPAGQYGGSLALAREHAWTAAALDARVGGYLDRPRGTFGANVNAGWAAANFRYLEGRTAAVAWDVDLHGTIGTTNNAGFSLVDGWTELRLGRGRDLALGYGYGQVFGAGPRFNLGGVRSTLLPEALTWTVVEAPFPASSADGPLHDRILVALDFPIRVMFQRDRVGEFLGKQGASFVGVELDANIGRQPYQRLPRASVVTGVACRLEDPDTGWDTAGLCTNIAEDYALWANVRFRP